MCNFKYITFTKCPKKKKNPDELYNWLILNQLCSKDCLLSFSYIFSQVNPSEIVLKMFLLGLFLFNASSRC